MRLLLYIVLAVVLTSALACLTIYVVLAYRGDSEILLRTSGDGSRLAIANKFFLGLAAVTLFVCLHEGAQAMLSWMPEHWGSADEHGEWEPLTGTIAVVFSFGTGLLLVQILDQVTRGRMAVRHTGEYASRLEKLLDASSSDSGLASFIEDLDKRLAELESAGREKWGLDLKTGWARRPEHARWEMYRQLRTLAEQRQARLADEKKWQRAQSERDRPK